MKQRKIQLNFIYIFLRKTFCMTSGNVCACECKANFGWRLFVIKKKKKNEQKIRKQHIWNLKITAKCAMCTKWRRKIKKHTNINVWCTAFNVYLLFFSFCDFYFAVLSGRLLFFLWVNDTLHRFFSFSFSKKKKYIYIWDSYTYVLKKVSINIVLLKDPIMKSIGIFSIIVDEIFLFLSAWLLG